MRKFACRYAVVQFVPYAETGEFANVGIVLACPETGFFGFRLQARRHARVTAFFSELSRDVYLKAVQAMQLELGRIAALAAVASSAKRADEVRALFEGLVHPREAIMRFGGPRALLAEAPADAVDQLFDHYVDRSFATPAYVEVTIEKRLRALLGGLVLPAPFRAERIGNDEIHARFPLVQRRDDQVAKIIKPFNLDQTEPVAIYDHGDAWLQKIRRLRQRHLLPRDVLFAVAAPPETDVKRFAAFAEIRGELVSTGVVVAADNADDVISDFALA